MDSKWLKKAFERATLASSWSEDDSTKVGACIISKENDFVIDGWNGLPRGVKLTPERLERPTKYLYFEHAERNAIYNAGRLKLSVANTAMAATHFPCCDCARAIIQSGIKEVYYLKTIDTPEWHEKNEASRQMFREAGVSYFYCDEDGEVIVENA